MGSEVPDDWRQAIEAKGWPDELVRRALELRVPAGVVHRWLTQPLATQEYVERRIHWHERLTVGSLRGREATQADNEAFADLCANSPEDLGEWEVSTERGPNAFAQFKLQRNVTVLVLEEQGQLIACCAFAMRNAFVAGRRLSVHYGQTLRVRTEFRRRGYGDQVRSLSWSAGVWRPTQTQYDYMRSQNFAVVNWWKKYSPAFFDSVPQREGDVPGLSVRVTQYPARAFDGGAPGIRRVRPRDIPRCVGLINRTHRGLDLFCPYSAEFLRDRLDEGFWGPRPPDWMAVYRWEDYYVLEEAGRVVACAGLWDRGRDMRDRWRHKATGEERVVSVTAVIDFGFAAGAEQAMARLLRFLIGETARLDRDFLAVPLDWLPGVAAELEDCEPILETRALRWGLPEVSITKPYTDLVYW